MTFLQKWRNFILFLGLVIADHVATWLKMVLMSFVKKSCGDAHVLN